MKIRSHKPEGGEIRRYMDTAVYQRFSGPSTEGRGKGSCIACALILMSDWRGFVRRQIKENPVA